ncbi:MAG TPA: hypothetical protein VEB64_18770 [Azospirillaceae bacterium]|nr:hypothetical protein [Azospirillaceae bacterium]
MTFKTACPAAPAIAKAASSLTVSRSARDHLRQSLAKVFIIVLARLRLLGIDCLD